MDGRRDLGTMEGPHPVADDRVHEQHRLRRLVQRCEGDAINVVRMDVQHRAMGGFDASPMTILDVVHIVNQS